MDARRHESEYRQARRAQPVVELRPSMNRRHDRQALLLPGALLMAVGAKLLAPLMFVDLCFSAFFQ
jgi:hypothetical protein